MDSHNVTIKVKVFDFYLFFGCLDDALRFCSLLTSSLSNVVCELNVVFDNGKSQENSSE